MTGFRRVVSALRAAWKVLRKMLHKPWLAWLLLSSLVAGSILIARSRGAFVGLEVQVLDRLIRSRIEPDKRDDVIRLVGMTEGDLERYGYPIDDELLLKVLQRVNAQEPCVIGLDMYRNLPEPRIRVGTPEEAADRARYAKFGEALLAMDRVYAIARYPLIPAPAALRGTERVTANNLLKDDVDGVYRRGPLFVKQEEKDEDGNALSLPALSLALTIKYLESQDIEMEFVQVVDDGVKRDLLRLGKTTLPWLGPDAGGYVDLQIFDYQYLVTFESPLNYGNRAMTERDPLGQMAIDTPYDYSFGDVIEGRVPPGAFTGKVVFVATVMQSIKDSNPTPIHDNLRGVHMHATMVRQLIDAASGKNMISWWPEPAEVLWIIGWTLLGGALGLYFRSPLRLVPAVLLTTIALALAAKVGFDRGFWLLFAAPGIGCLFAAALVTSFVVLIERADRAAVQMILNKHVSPRVADYIMGYKETIADGGMIPARALRATIMFTDLAGFSTASEKLTPEQTLRWLNDYMTEMVKIIEKYGGDVNKYIGDAIMALFGAPVASHDDAGLADDATKAIKAALEMRVEVPKLNARWCANAPDMPPVAMRVGIFTGPIVDGGFGATDRTEYTVIGDAVNRSNRLEAAGKEIKSQLTEPEKDCTILIGPETFERVGHLFETVAVENLALKGITERATVYRVLSERQTQPTSQPTNS